MPLHEENTANTLDKISDDSLIRLVYISSLTLKSRFKPAIFETVEQEARQYNQQHGITGTLCYGNGHFLQCLEGKSRYCCPLCSISSMISATIM
nr:BLUF domain-containing protein [Psychrobacter sp. PraFG1]UTT87716.1 BLUF domain-containing protein [Psychrobacter sp. PraFG1]